MANLSTCLCLYAILIACSLKTTVKSLNIEGVEVTKRTTQKNHLPTDWEEFCKLKESTGKYKHYFCDIQVRHSGKWNFLTLKEYIAKETTKYKFDIICEHPANITLQWPLKAKNIVHLDVRNCELEHYLDGYSAQIQTSTLAELEYVHVEDCIIIISIMEMLNIVRFLSNLDKNYGCIHEETLKYYAFKNNSYRFDNSLESSTGSDIIEMNYEMLSKLKHKCLYLKLEHVDLSVNHRTSKLLPELTIENSAFPSLTILNISDNLVPNLAAVYRKWYRYYPKLEVMDLSHNFITEIEFDPSADAWDHVPLLRMNMSYNKISELKVPKLEELIDTKKLFIDFSHNPLNCTCTEETKQLITFVNDQSKWSQPKYQKYAFMMDLECTYPKDIQGRRLTELKIGDLGCKL